MRIAQIILILLISTSVFPNNSDHNISINNNKSKILDLNEYTYTYSTKDTSLDIYNIIKCKFKYSPTGLKGINTNSIHWERFTFNNNTDSIKELYIYFPYSVTNKIYAYSVYQDSVNHLISTGLYFGKQNKDYDAVGYPIKIRLLPKKTTIYIKIDHIFQGLRTISFVLSKQELIRLTKNTKNIIWLWKGFFFFASIISIILFFVSRIRMFLYYFLLNLGIGIFFFGEIGEISRFLSINPPNLTANIKQSGILLALIFLPLLINKITPIAKLRPKLWKVMYLSTALLSITWFACLFPYVQTTYFLYLTTYLYNIYSGIFLILQLYFLYVAFKAKNRNAKTLFFGYTIYILFAFLYIILPNLGFIKNSLNTYNLFIYGSIVEIVTLIILMGKEVLYIQEQRTILLEKQKNHQIEIIKAIVESQEIERNKVGRELHDMIGANISVIKQQVDKNNKALTNLIERTIESVRNLSHGLVTPLIKDDAFIDEINELCFLFTNSDTKIQSNFYNWVKIDDSEKATHIYRIIQELLQNAIKHSHAKEVFIQFIVNNDNKLTIMYEDDGVGFDYKKAYNKKGLGLINIYNRIKLINATITYDTKENRKGTTIIIEMEF